MSIPRHKKQFATVVILAAAVLVGGAALMAYLVRYSATSERVCVQCHPDQTEMWERSQGHPAEMTHCHECHSPGQRIIPANLNIIKHARDQLVPSEYLADDELTSNRCLECHTDILDFGYQIKKKIVNFTHRNHIGEGLDCVDCHRTAGHEYLKNGTNRPHVSECLRCHLREFLGPPKSQKCLNCHDVILAPGKSW